ncbi:MAG TPA: tetratricopeptide repeat protein [Candidatus Aminicenantes bacterium]|nr:tetratricopeptide repeat protein [Candidatus Aminicenantes bacterium]HRY64168.1 tetratricopeptide repeat protein [Candidatus Aminicenantes bacterium]HRZ71081.1 tetratricopeptide repeat protein [Candidatus Aminicenantes bacterium]
MKRSILALTVAGALCAAAACARPLASGALTAGITAAQNDDWDEAFRQWTAAVGREPGSAAAHNNLAVACEKKGAWDEAAREYETALRLDPQNPEIKANYESFLARREAARRKGP